LVGKNTRG